jgi:hypothetical protein
MTANMTTIPLTQRSLAFTASPTWAEFLEQTADLAPAIRNRLREVRIPVECQSFFVQYPYVLNLFLLVDEESPEMVVVAPVLAALAQASARFSLRIVRSTDDLSALDRLVDELELIGSINEIVLPLLLVFDEDWNYQGQWGPHPQAAEAFWESWFDRFPEYDDLAIATTAEGQASYAALLAILTQEMRVWYNSGLTAACIREVQGLLAGLLDEESAGDEE